MDDLVPAVAGAADPTTALAASSVKATENARVDRVLRMVDPVSVVLTDGGPYASQATPSLSRSLSEFRLYRLVETYGLY